MICNKARQTVFIVFYLNCLMGITDCSDMYYKHPSLRRQIIDVIVLTFQSFINYFVFKNQ